MTTEEICLLRLHNQHLLSPAAPETVLQDLCGLQAQFFGNAIHALRIRSHPFDEAAVCASLVKNWTLRGTVHLFSKADLALFLHCKNGSTYRKNEWTDESFWNQRIGWALTPDRQAFFCDRILEAVRQQPQTREQLKTVCRQHGMTEAEEDSLFDPWGGGIREMCERGFLHYAAGEEKVFCETPPFVPIPEAEAKLAIARRYFTHYGPATIHDAMYFFHTTAAQVKGWLRQLPVKDAACEGRTYYWIATDHATPQAVPDCLFLAGFDPLLLGYEKKESLILAPEHLRGIFNLAGIVMPAILLHGRVAGRWKQKGKRMEITPFCPLSVSERGALERAAFSLWPDCSAVRYPND